MTIRIEKLDGDLATGAATTLESYRGAVLALALADNKDLVNASNLEGNVVQLFMLRPAGSAANQGNRMMIGTTVEKRKAAGLEVLGINLRHFESQDLRIKKQRTLQISDLQDNMPETANLETYAGRRLKGSQLFDIQSHGCLRILG